MPFTTYIYSHAVCTSRRWNNCRRGGRERAFSGVHRSGFRPGAPSFAEAAARPSPSCPCTRSNRHRRRNSCLGDITHVVAQVVAEVIAQVVVQVVVQGFVGPAERGAACIPEQRFMACIIGQFAVWV